MGGATTREALLEVRDLRVTFTGRAQPVYAVNGVDFTLAAGEALGIVGESGCGKSTMLRTLVGLYEPKTTVCSGSVRYAGDELLGRSESSMRRVRGAEISMIFQDPMSYLNPVLKISEQIGETLQRHTTLNRRERRERTLELLRLVGISAPQQRLKQYPHELSGGMRQRVIIAIALACEPRVLLADEPTTALDVSIQDQILRLLADLRRRLGMSMVIVSHDLGVIAQTCDRVMVMYGGELVELAPVRQLVRTPHHPYTAGLLRSLPGSVPSRYLHAISGMPPRLHRSPKQCSFRERCELATEACESWNTSLLSVDPDHAVRCLNHEQVRVDG
jgi:peptide/nickel transport system ATP-binding protein